MALDYQNFATGNFLPSLAGAAGTGLTAYQQNQQNNGAWNTATNASHFGPFGATGLGGIGGNFAGGNTGLNLGMLANPYAQFAGLSGADLSTASGINGLPGNVSAANFMTPGINGAFGLAGGQLPGTVGLANTMFQGAGQQAAAASMNPNAYANSVYQNLSAQAQPWEQQQQNALMDKEFASGNLGSSGGALQTQAFAQGLGQADLSRQLQAQQLAQNNMSAAAQRASQLGGLGNSMLSNAFSNFGNISGLGISNLGAQSSLSFLPANLQGAYLSNAGQAVQGANNAQQSALNVFNAGLNAQTQNSAAMARGGQLQNQLALQNAYMGNASPWGTALQGLSQGGGSNPLMQAFQNFSSGTNPFGDFGAFGGTPTNFSGDAFNTAFNEAGLNNIGSLGTDLGGFSGASGQAAAGLGQTAGGLGGGVAGASAAAGGGAAAGGFGTGLTDLGSSLDAGLQGYADAGIAGAGADAASSGAAGAALGSVGAATAAALPLAMLAWAASRPNSGTALGSQYWSNLSNTLNAGPGNATPTAGGQAYMNSIKQNTAYQGARSELLQALAGGGGSGAYQGMPYSPQQLAAWGITPQTIADFRSMQSIGPGSAALAAAAGLPNYSKPSYQGK